MPRLLLFVPTPIKKIDIAEVVDDIIEMDRNLNVYSMKQFCVIRRMSHGHVIAEL